MSYRLLLEVPDRLVDQANIAVGLAGDAQVILARDSHGLTFDDPYQDLSVVAHSLAIVDTLFEWAGELGPDRDKVSILLHGGRRITLATAAPDAVIAAIRRDQPWVESSIPKIGEHVEDELAPDDWPTPPENTTAELMAAEDMPIVPRLSPNVVTEGPDYSLIRVNDLRRAEEFYSRTFGLTIQQRFRAVDEGVLIPVEGAVNWATADRAGTMPTVSFLSNDTLRIALQNVGIGIRLDLQSFTDRLATTVEPATLGRIKADVLMRGYNLLSQSDDSLTFRDPFGVTWDLTTQQVPRLTSTATTA